MAAGITITISVGESAGTGQQTRVLLGGAGATPQPVEQLGAPGAASAAATEAPPPQDVGGVGTAGADMSAPEPIPLEQLGMAAVAAGASEATAPAPQEFLGTSTTTAAAPAAAPPPMALDALGSTGGADMAAGGGPPPAPLEATMEGEEAATTPTEPRPLEELEKEKSPRGGRGRTR